MNYQWSDPFIILLRFCQTLQTINNDIIFNIAGTKIKCNAPILFFIFLVPNYCKWLICLEFCSVWNILWNILSTVCQYAFYLFLLWEENILLSVSRFIKYCEQYGWFSVICSVLKKSSYIIVAFLWHHLDASFFSKQLLAVTTFSVYSLKYF